MRTGLGVLAVMALVSSECGGDDDSSPGGRAAAPAATERWNSEDVEYRLAAIQGDSLTDASVDRYAASLDRAEEACSNPRERIADFSVAGKQIVEDAGGSTTLLELLDALPESVPEEARPMDCADIMAAVVTLMTQ